MSIFGESYRATPATEEDVTLESFNDLQDPDSLLEMFLIDDISRLSQEQLDEFCKPGGAGEALVEAGMLRKKTFVRLSKQDDLERRVMMASMDLAREAKDTLWTALAKNRVKEKELLEKIRSKYGARAEKVAKVGQKEYMKKKKFHLPASFNKAGGEDRIGV